MLPAKCVFVHTRLSGLGMSVCLCTWVQVFALEFLVCSFHSSRRAHHRRTLCASIGGCEVGYAAIGDIALCAGSNSLKHASSKKHERPRSRCPHVRTVNNALPQRSIAKYLRMRSCSFMTKRAVPIKRSGPWAHARKCGSSWARRTRTATQTALCG